MKKYKKSLISIIIVVSLIIITGLLFNIAGCYPSSYSAPNNNKDNIIPETGSKASTVFANYGTWIWCGILLIFFLIPAIVVSLIIYLVSRQKIDIKVLEEKRSKGLKPKNKSVAVILSIFFSFWSWLYTYKINYKKFWITFSIIFGYFFTIIIIIISVPFDAASIFSNYGTWIWLFWLLLSGSIWLWALLDNSLKPTSFYMNYPEGIDPEKDNLHKHVEKKNLIDGSKKENKKIFCMQCGTELPADAIYCKNCGEKVR
jgi:ribosomal protein L40E